MKHKRPYIIQKTVMATSIHDALRREKSVEVSDIRLSENYQPEELLPAIGFHAQLEEPEEDE